MVERKAPPLVEFDESAPPPEGSRVLSGNVVVDQWAEIPPRSALRGVFAGMVNYNTQYGEATSGVLVIQDERWGLPPHLVLNRLLKDVKPGEFVEVRCHGVVTGERYTRYDVVILPKSADVSAAKSGDLPF